MVWPLINSAIIKGVIIRSYNKGCDHYEWNKGVAIRNHNKCATINCWTNRTEKELTIKGTTRDQPLTVTFRIL